MKPHDEWSHMMNGVTYTIAWPGIMECFKISSQSCMLASLYDALEICHSEMYKHVLYHCMQETYAKLPTEN